MSALVKVETNKMEIIPLDQTPEYLKDSREGMEALGTRDFKIPRITLLQPLSPECRTYPGVAIPGYFWHTGANVSLGKQFNMIAGLVSKRAILFKPRHDGGGILAFSGDTIRWDTGGNKSFVIRPNKDNERTVIWETGKDVKTSGLLEWGSFDPDNEGSQPAATLIYEYLVYLPDAPNHSPALLSMAKTAVASAKALNSSLRMTRKATSAVVVEMLSKEVTEGSNTWYIPSGRTIGYAPEHIKEMVGSMGKQFSNYQAEYTEEVEPTSAQKDEIPF